MGGGEGEGEGGGVVVLQASHHTNHPNHIGWGGLCHGHLPGLPCNCARQHLATEPRPALLQNKARVWPPYTYPHLHTIWYLAHAYIIWNIMYIMYTIYMYTCIYVYVYMMYVCTYVYLCTHVYFMYICTMYICTHVYLHVYKYYVHMHICLYYVHGHVYICKYI